MATAPIMDMDITSTRREPRKSMFVMATLYAATGSAPVKVRDMSSAGALIEGGVIPAPGTTIRLCRGSLSVTGKVAWSKEARAGLSFDSTVSPDDWLPTGKAPAPQQRVDEMVQQVKGSMGNQAAITAPLSVEPASVTALELTRLRRAIEELADDLAEDDAVLARHGAKLQTLDHAAQLLRKLATQTH
jgi:hypothetical protein